MLVNNTIYLLITILKMNFSHKNFLTSKSTQVKRVLEIEFGDGNVPSRVVFNLT